MVDAITQFVVGKIGNYLIEEASMLMGVKDELLDLKTELMCIQGYLRDVEAREREDEASKVWTKLVLDIAYDVEDVLEGYYPKVEERSKRRGLKRMTNQIGRKKDDYLVVDDIRTLKRRILDVTRKRETYGIGNNSETREGENSSSLRVRQLRRVRSIDQDELVVGLKDDAKILLAKLRGGCGDNKRFVISIFGMGGLGKTALARKLYNMDDVKTGFKYRAWTYVSQDYKTKDILMRIIRSLGEISVEDIEKIRNFSEEELEAYLHGLLQGKKYLVVVDDIWEREAWESLKRALPENHNGSRVIITTRIRAVAEGVDGRVYAHSLRFLTFEESWKLFEHRAFTNVQKVNQDLQSIGKEMVQKCGGLPLAIVVLAGLLSKKRPSEWYDVCATLWRRLKDNSIHISTVFDLSFKDLPRELKLCFLYLSVFPEDYEIDVEKLIHLLVAEGFAQEGEEMMMEDTARYYIEELIDRSLVKAERIDEGKIISCRVHDLLRDVAIKKAKELNFVHVYNEKQYSTTCRREAVHHLMKDHLYESVNKRMRSFLIFGEGKRIMLESLIQTITLNMKLLRVLNLGGLVFTREESISLTLPDTVGGLIHLRYLGIPNIGLHTLPTLISNLQFLQTLDASGNDFDGTINLSELTALRHVIGNFVGNLILEDAVNLQTLRSISSYSWSQLKHDSLKNLRNLEIYDSKKLIRVCLNFGSFSKLTNLRVLTLRVPSFFSIVGIFGLDVILPSLVSLTFSGTNVIGDPMPVLRKLPRLEELVLKDCELELPNMSIRAQDFTRLRKFELYMVSLDELQIEEEAMPNLMELKLTDKTGPPKLMIPDRLRAFTRLTSYF